MPRFTWSILSKSPQRDWDRYERETEGSPGRGEGAGEEFGVRTARVERVVESAGIVDFVHRLRAATLRGQHGPRRGPIRMMGSEAIATGGRRLRVSLVKSVPGHVAPPTNTVVAAVSAWDPLIDTVQAWGEKGERWFLIVVPRSEP